MGKYNDKVFWEALDILTAEAEIIIDRLKGSRHPRYPNIIYPLDYGYLQGTSSMDGGGIDVWRGSKDCTKVDSIICTVDLLKKDSEIKLLIGCTELEKQIAYQFHNETEYMKGLIIYREELAVIETERNLLSNIVKADESNLQEWAELTYELFKEGHSYEEILKNCSDWLHNNKENGYLYKIDGKYVALINISIRNDYVNGTDGSPVAFVEAIFVMEEFRRKGIGKELIKAAESFAREIGCTQLASDCLIDNVASENFHKSCGFKETERVIYFVKNLF